MDNQRILINFHSLESYIYENDEYVRLDVNILLNKESDFFDKIEDDLSYETEDIKEGKIYYMSKNKPNIFYGFKYRILFKDKSTSPYEADLLKSKARDAMVVSQLLRIQKILDEQENERIASA